MTEIVDSKNVKLSKIDGERDIGGTCAVAV